MTLKTEPIIYDFIIVGQGIAGSIMTHFLLQQNKKVLVIDNFNPNSASNIASGVVNPITGRKMVKSWIIDEVLPFAKTVYKNLEKQLQVRFFYEEDIYKIFSSDEDAAIWNQKKNDPEYENYLGNIVSDLGENIIAPFGAGIIKQGCWMDVPVFIKAYREFLKQHNCLLEETLNKDELNVADKIQYKNVVADKIIFCEGYKAYQNPYFDFIPFALAKGEQLTIHSPNLKNEKIINKNIFILPKQDDLYSVGSTFIWDDFEETVTDNGRKEITDKLNKFIKSDYKIVEEKAGIRPAMEDRRPVIGAHPKYPNLFIFNGLGTKGVSLAPYFSQHLIDHFVLKTDIMSEVSLNRFLKRNIKSSNSI